MMYSLWILLQCVICLTALSVEELRKFGFAFAELGDAELYDGNSDNGTVEMTGKLIQVEHFGNFSEFRLEFLEFDMPSFIHTNGSYEPVDLSKCVLRKNGVFHCPRNETECSIPSGRNCSYSVTETGDGFTRIKTVGKYTLIATTEEMFKLHSKPLGRTITCLVPASGTFRMSLEENVILVVGNETILGILPPRSSPEVVNIQFNQCGEGRPANKYSEDFIRLRQNLRRMYKRVHDIKKQNERMRGRIWTIWPYITGQ